MKVSLYVIIFICISWISFTIHQEIQKGKSKNSVMKITQDEVDEWKNRISYLKDHETGKYYMLIRLDNEITISEVSASVAEKRIMNPR